MDRILSYFILFAICGFLVIGGNYFLTDDVGNFSMEKAKNLIPNITVAIIEKKDEITGTRDINKDMGDEKDAERLSAEGHKDPRGVMAELTGSILGQYFKGYKALDFKGLTTLQKKQAREIFIKKYKDQRFHWTGNIFDIVEYSGSYLLSVSHKDWKYEFLFCEMVKNALNRIALTEMKKKDVVTVTGDFKMVMDDPWLENCEVVD